MNETCVLAVTAALLAGLLGPATAASQELLFHFPMDDTASSGGGESGTRTIFSSGSSAGIRLGATASE